MRPYKLRIFCPPFKAGKEDSNNFKDSLFESDFCCW